MSDQIEVLKAHETMESYIWVIEGFSFLDSTLDQYILSKKFVLSGNLWQLSLYPGGTTAHPGKVMIYLENFEPRPVTASTVYRILGGDGTTKVSQAGTTTRYGAKSGQSPHLSAWGPTNWLERKDVLDPIKGLLHNDTLRLKVTVTIVKQGDKASNGSPKPEKALADFGGLLDSGTHSDVTLVVQGTEITAHRAILSARSQFFAAMFTCKMRESLEGRVTLDDTPLPVFCQLLRFLYTGSCDLTAGEAKSEQKAVDAKALLAADDRYQGPDLQLLCSAKLAESVSVHNAAELLIVADQYHTVDLKRRVFEFVQEDPSRLAEVLDTDASQQLSAPLVQELVSVTKRQPAKLRAALKKEDVKALKMSELRAELESRGLDTSGLKAELVERLENALQQGTSASQGSDTVFFSRLFSA